MTILYVINAKDNLNKFYDEIETKLCDEKLAFGRNLDALHDLLTGDFGKLLYNKQNKIKTELLVYNSNLLSSKIKKMFEKAEIESEEYYEPFYTHSYKWLTITLK